MRSIDEARQVADQVTAAAQSGATIALETAEAVERARELAAGGAQAVTRATEAMGAVKEGSAAVLWAILDTIVDDYAPVIEGLERDVEEVEKTVFSGAAAPTERIYLLRREATDFYRAVHPLLAPLEALERGTYIDVSEELSQFFRDVNDHLKLVNEEVIALRDVLATILQANMAVISNQQNEISVRQNETMKQLTVVATIFLPLTFITGFFGMNFSWLINAINSFWIFAVYGVGSLVLSALVIYYWFRRSGDIGRIGRPSTPSYKMTSVRAHEVPGPGVEGVRSSSAG